MDFVVVGFGVGALGVWLGVLMRGWLAARGERAAWCASDPAVAAYERASAAEYRGAGQAFLAAGCAVVLATVGGLVGALDDRTGALLVATTATVAALGILLWGYLYRSRNPMPRRPRRRQPVEDGTGVPALGADLAADAPVGGVLVLTAVDDAAEPDGSHPSEEAPMPAAVREPGGAEVAAEDAVAAPEHPVPAEVESAHERPDADAPAEDSDAAPGEAERRDMGAAANGHPGDAAVADEGKVVEFAGRGARTGRGEVVSDNEEGADER